MRKTIFIFLLLTVIGIGALHFFTPGHLGFYHDTYRRLSYFPIVVGAILYGMWGGVTLAVLTSIAFIPHILLYIGYGAESYISELTEIILYLSAAVVIGIIAGRETRLREKYKRLSEKLKESYNRLHDEAALMLEVEEQLQASQKLSALGQLSASLAHEIKNPLGSIKGTAEILLDDFPENHPKREFVKILTKEVERLNASVDEVLHFSRGSLIAGPIENSESLSQVIDRVCKLLKTELSNKKIDIQLKDLEIGDECVVDGNRFSQVFMNILLNAVDAVKKQGKIEVALVKEKEGVSVFISDNGPGVSEVEKDRIFQPFYSKKENGTGLGLSISRKIVESFGGSLTASDLKWGGACFHVQIPLSKEPALSLP